MKVCCPTTLIYHTRTSLSLQYIISLLLQQFSYRWPKGNAHFLLLLHFEKKIIKIARIIQLLFLAFRLEFMWVFNLFFSHPLKISYFSAIISLICIPHNSCFLPGFHSYCCIRPNFHSLVVAIVVGSCHHNHPSFHSCCYCYCIVVGFHHSFGYSFAVGFARIVQGPNCSYSCGTQHWCVSWQGVHKLLSSWFCPHP